MRVAIVGAEAAKFTPPMIVAAKALIHNIIDQARVPVVVVSGGCHLGGVDIWAEEEALALGVGTDIYRPKDHSWGGADGFMTRNQKIAQNCDELHVVTVSGYHEGYTGMRFPKCYHCNTYKHIKSGGCWTGKLAQKLGVPTVWHVVEVE